MEEKSLKKVSGSALALILLSFTVYYFAYLGRYSYSSNINCVIDYYGVSKASAGSVGTFFFIAYGVGQVVNGLLCSKYNPRYAIFIALVFSAISNFAVGFIGVENFNLLKITWLVNGFAQSVLWSSLIRLLNGYLPRKNLGLAIFIMGFPVSTGTFTIYGLSSLLSALDLSFKKVFFIAGTLMIIIALIWFFGVDKLKQKCSKERESENAVSQNEKQELKSESSSSNFIAVFCLLALFAVANNLVKDGLTTWMPAIMREKYQLKNAFSTFLTLFLPIFALMGGTLAIYLNKKLKNYVVVCGVFYLASFAMFVAVLLLLSSSIWILPLICFVLVALAMSGVNNVITNIFPMLYPNKNAGALAGVLDGFCYLGSAITSFGMGSVADNYGWNTVFYIFLAICALMILICIVYLALLKAKTKLKSKN